MCDQAVLLALARCLINCACAILSECFYHWIVHRQLREMDKKLKNTDHNERKIEWYSTVRAIWLVRLWRRKTLWHQRTDADSGNQNLQHLFILTLGSVTTIVGVCMLMKHDGMDLRGWVGVVFKGNDLPYPLCPMLGECLQFHVAEFASTSCD
jgi:hypothetical protein